MLKRNTAQFIAECRKKHGDKYDYSKVKYTGYKKKVCIVCPEHGEFYQIAGGHLKRGSGCVQCGHESTKAKTRKSLSQWLEDFRSVHGNKYDYSKTGCINNAREKIKILCRACGDHPFFIDPNTHKRGHGCPTCGIKRRAAAKTYSQAEFVRRATEVHGDKYSYEKATYIKGVVPVDVFCRKCESYFSIKPINLINQRCGCPACKSGGGFNANQPGKLYYLRAKDKTTNDYIFKLGITNNSTKERYGSYLGDEAFYELEFNSGVQAKQTEKQLFEMFSEFRIRSNHFGRRNGTTEWFSKDVLGMFGSNPQFFSFAIAQAVFAQSG